MCGIVAYIGSKPARPLLLEGLKRLEYRGYDSAGLAVLNGTIEVAKAVGRVGNLEKKLKDMPGFEGTLGLAHTRWATHGGVTEPNAHPHQDQRAGIALVHNGIIENYAALKKLLTERGHTFQSDTDTEVLAVLIGELYEGDLEAAVQAALREVTGAYAIAVMCAQEPDVLVCARKGSPLMVGVGAGECVVASDPSAIVAHTSQAFALEDYNVARITREGFRTSTIDNKPVTPKMMQLELDLEQAELGAYEHYMLKEIFEQPASLRTTMRGRVDVSEGKIVLGGLMDCAKELVKTRRYILLAQGTALHAAMIGEYLIEDLAKVPAECEFASEFRYRNPIIEDRTAVIAVSQSGETIDTLSALQEARDRGALSLGVINVVGSTIARETDAGVYLRVGPEIGVASTKAFTGQVAVLSLISLFLARRRFMSDEASRRMLDDLLKIPDAIETALESNDVVRRVTEKYIERENWLFLGRGYNYPTALEGALKLKEISYIHAEGMPAAEMLYVPQVPDCLSPMVTVIPLQLMAYHAAVLRGHDVDKPRNLAKSVTVE